MIGDLKKKKKKKNSTWAHMKLTKLAYWVGYAVRTWLNVYFKARKDDVNAGVPRKIGSSFHPSSVVPTKRKDVITSVVCWTTTVALLVGSRLVISPILLLKLYEVSYVIFVIRLDFVTYLYHHDHEDKIPWYCTACWSVRQPCDCWFLFYLLQYSE